MNKRPKAPAATSTDVGALGKTGFPNVMTGFPSIYQSPQPASQHISFIHEHSGQPDLLVVKKAGERTKTKQNTLKQSPGGARHSYLEFQETTKERGSSIKQLNNVFQK